MTEEQAKKFARDISIGLTCNRFISLYMFEGNIVVTHHKGHTEYFGYGSVYCSVEYRVFKYDDNIKYRGDEYLYKKNILFKIEGRLTNKKKEELINRVKELSSSLF